MFGYPTAFVTPFVVMHGFPWGVHLSQGLRKLQCKGTAGCIHVHARSM